MSLKGSPRGTRMASNGLLKVTLPSECLNKKLEVPFVLLLFFCLVVFVVVETAILKPTKAGGRCMWPLQALENTALFICIELKTGLTWTQGCLVKPGLQIQNL